MQVIHLESATSAITFRKPAYMKHLFEKLRDDTQNWRKEGYPCLDYPLVGEVLRYQFEGEPQEQISPQIPPRTAIPIAGTLLVPATRAKNPAHC